MNRHYEILSCFCLLLFLAGCVNKQTGRQPFFNQQAAEAETYQLSGQHKQAANIFESLANSNPANHQHYTLLAAEAHIQSGDSQAAKSVLESINLSNLSEQQRNKLNLLQAQINLSNGEAEQALIRLNMTQVYSLTHSDQIIFYQSLAFAHSLSGNLLQSAKARIQLTPLLKDSEQVLENNQVILKTLQLLPLQTLSLQQPPAPDILGGWMHLAQLLKYKQFTKNTANLQTQIAEWQMLFPQHPANSDFLVTLLEGKKHSFKIPNTIAILLPENGRFAQPAAIIKKGFLTAYHESQSGFQPSIRFYDTSADNSVSLYHQAINEGAEMIIGPLSKSNIEDLALNTELTVPVLALNHISNLAKDNLFQFGLSPIDDTSQITKLAAEDNHKKALLLTPNNNQGKRIAQYLQQNWESLEGVILEQQSYNTKESDFSLPIKSLLNLDESRQRYRRLQRVIAQNVEFTERRRQDVDAIFLSATPQSARSIYPQLQFYRANNVPVYATSRVYSGVPNKSHDIDLNSISFCDIPWLFPEIYQGDQNQQSLRRIWQKIPRRYLRLLALGLDSFNMISYLDQLDSTFFSGATGALTINLENRITRQLACAKFVDGIPVLVDYSPTEPDFSTTEDMIYSDDLTQ